MSIKPKSLVDILNGKKTIEIRKSCPKDIPEDGIDVYMYCSYEKGQPVGGYYNKKLEFVPYGANVINGRVVGKFRLYGNTLGHVSNGGNGFDDGSMRIYKGCYDTLWGKRASKYLKKACLSEEEYEDYVGLSKWQSSDGPQTRLGTAYAWHIEHLEVYDKPKELDEFYTICKEKDCRNKCIADHDDPYVNSKTDIQCGMTYLPDDGGIPMPIFDRKIPIKRPPSSWQYVEID